MLRQFTRKLSGSCYLSAQVSKRTTINPVKVLLKPPESFSPKSLLVLATPSVLNSAIDKSIKLHNERDLQIVVAGMDTVIPGSNRHGISELWSDEYFNIEDAKILSDKDDSKQEHTESINSRRNWKPIQASFKLTLNQTQIKLNPSNTLFSTGHAVTLFYLQPQTLSDDTSDHTLNELSVTLSSAVSSGMEKIDVYDHWTPLYDPQPTLRITDCVGNLVKSINKQSAAGFLESNEKLLGLSSKDTEVFVKVIKPNAVDIVYRYQVIAGGGGWGAKASILVLSPHAKIARGDIVEFYMLTPDNRFQTPISMIKESEVEGKFIFECSFEQRSFDSDIFGDEKIFDDVFGCGCEAGFALNGVSHVSAGETVVIT